MIGRPVPKISSASARCFAESAPANQAPALKTASAIIAGSNGKPEISPLT